jgi:hypothetical protein
MISQNCENVTVKLYVGYTIHDERPVFARTLVEEYRNPVTFLVCWFGDVLFLMMDRELK